MSSHLKAKRYSSAVASTMFICNCWVDLGRCSNKIKNMIKCYILFLCRSLLVLIALQWAILYFYGLIAWLPKCCSFFLFILGSVENMVFHLHKKEEEFFIFAFIWHETLISQNFQVSQIFFSPCELETSFLVIWKQSKVWWIKTRFTMSFFYFHYLFL